MLKKYIVRTLAIVALCFISQLIKSEEKSCSTACMTMAAKPASKTAAVKVETADEEIITYFGFYSKY